MEITRKHIYKMYRDGVFLGVLQNVTSPFRITEEINTAGAELQVTVAVSMDNAGDPVSPLLEETGEPLLTEDGAAFTEESAPDLAGPAGTFIQHNDNVEVIEVSDYHPNGKVVFYGYVTRWRGTYGNTQGEIGFTALSEGSDLDQYIYLAGGYTLEQSQFTGSTLRSFDTTGGTTTKRAQSFQHPSDMTVGKISVKLSVFSGTNDVTLVLNQGIPTGAMTQIASKTVSISNTTPAFVDFIFASPVALTASTTYTFVLSVPDKQFAYCTVDVTQPYANGTAYYYNGASWSSQSEDVAFGVYSTNNSTVNNYDDADPADMFRDAIDSAAAQGALIQYTGASVDDTGVSADYSFKLATVLETCQKARELAPADWYWYVDPATYTAYLQSTPTTRTHFFVKGRHLGALTIESTIEEVINTVYFSGGDVGGGVNLFTRYVNQDSLVAVGRQRLARISDNRVTVQSTADRIAQGVLFENDTADYQTPIVLHNDAYDCLSIHPGDVVGFGGFGNFIDGLLVQVVRITRLHETTELELGRLFRRQDASVEEARRSINKLQTIDNPSSPS